MPKGRRETFKVEIFPDHGQRKAIDAVEREASGLHKSVEQELVRQYNTIKLFHSEQEVVKAVFENRSYFGSSLLDEHSVTAVARSAYASFLERVSAADGEDIELRRGRRVKPEVDVRLEDVVFAVTERVVRVPYVGLVKHAMNRFILTNFQRPPEGGVSEEKKDLNRRLRRVFLGTQNSVYYLLMDCTDPRAAAREGGPTVARGPSRAGRGLPTILKD